MKFLKSSVVIGCFGLLAAASGASLVQAAPLAGLSVAAQDVQALEQTFGADVVPDQVHYKPYRHHHHHHYYGGSFFREYYGEWPRYYPPSFHERLDEYTYYYPPFYY